jgi:hypothetical protein
VDSKFSNVSSVVTIPPFCLGESCRACNLLPSTFFKLVIALVCREVLGIWIDDDAWGNDVTMRKFQLQAKLRSEKISDADGK